MGKGGFWSDRHNSSWYLGPTGGLVLLLTQELIPGSETWTLISKYVLIFIAKNHKIIKNENITEFIIGKY